MLALAETNKNFASNMVTQLLKDTPLPQTLAMIEFIGNFFDARCFLLLKNFLKQKPELKKEIILALQKIAYSGKI